MKKYLFIGAALIALGFGAISARESSMDTETNAQQPTRVSLVQLIANPNEYDGKFVRVIGFVSVEFEGTAVYLHQEDFKYDITQNAIWLEMDFERNKKLNQRYVLIEGTFDANHNGHKGLFSGSIKDIKRLQVWP
ncbi:MAG TPA: hypothetical protein VFY61_11940 [Pyrinomonadaceae bacterium]|nr:hypothetical protein [Pyrinomonadaceae bacterium]